MNGITPVIRPSCPFERQRDTQATMEATTETVKKGPGRPKKVWTEEELAEKAEAKAAKAAKKAEAKAEAKAAKKAALTP